MKMMPKTKTCLFLLTGLAFLTLCLFPCSDAVGQDAAVPKTADVLAIAKKYYGVHSGALTGDLKSEFDKDVGTVGFDGKSKNDAKAEELCSRAALIVAFRGDGNSAVACAAAAVGVSPEYPRSAGTLASMLHQVTTVKDKDRLTDAKKLAEYAISLDKNDIEFYITLSLIRQDLNDLDGAMKAIDDALAVNKNHNTALTVKLNILAKSSRPSISGKDIGNDLVENDGELSKRDRETEDSTKNMEGPKDGDSKEIALDKLNQIYDNLEPITPADMMEKLFPAQSKELREKIKTVSEEDKKLGLPDFPLKLVNDMDAVMSGGYMQYTEWHTGRIGEFWKKRESLSRASTTVRIAPTNPMTATAADYMRDYNKQVVRAAIDNYFHFCQELYRDAQDTLDVQDKKLEEKEKVYAEQRKAEIAAGVPSEVANLNYKTKCNAAVKEAVSAIIPAYHHWYTEARKEGERLWEEMLPYARCTANPGSEVSGLYHYVTGVYSASGSASAAVFYAHHLGAGMYTPGAEGELEKAIEEATKSPGPGSLNVLEGLTLSASLGAFEFKLSANGVEVEVVAGLAMRVAYNPTKNQAEFGMGVGYQAKVGVAAAQTGVEAKGYMNFVFDLRNKEVTDIYYTAEVKGSFVGLEGGGQVRVSAFGKGASLSTAAKQKFGGMYALEHEKEILSTAN